MNLTTHYNLLTAHRVFKTKCSDCGAEIERMAIANRYACFDCKKKRIAACDRARSELRREKYRVHIAEQQTREEWINAHRHDVL